MWARPRTSTGEREQLEHGADVDLGRLEQDLAERPAEPLVVERHLAQRPAGERVAVRVQPARWQADQRVAGLDPPPVTIASSATSPIALPPSSTPETISPTWAISPPGISIPASSAPVRSPTPIAAQTSGLGLRGRG